MKNQRNLVSAILTCKCPSCRKGPVFQQKSVFPLKTCLRLHQYCNHCGVKIKVENNYGQGMNFVFIIAVFIVTLLWYWPLVGLSYKDNSIFYFLGVGTVSSIVLQPWIMRYSRVLFLYLVTPFQPTSHKPIS